MSPGPRWGRREPPALGDGVRFQKHVSTEVPAQQGEARSASGPPACGALSSSPPPSMPFPPRQMFPKDQTDLCELPQILARLPVQVGLFCFLIKSFLKVLNIPGTLFALLSSLPLGFSIRLVTLAVNRQALPRGGSIQIQPWFPVEQLRCAQDAGHGRGPARSLAAKPDGKPRQNFPANPRGLVASASAVTPATSHGERLAFPATARPVSWRL